MRKKRRRRRSNLFLIDSVYLSKKKRRKRRSLNLGHAAKLNKLATAWLSVGVGLAAKMGSLITLPILYTKA